MALQYHPEYFKAIEPLLPAMSQVKQLAVHDVNGRRARLDVMLGPLLAAVPFPQDVEVNTYHTQTKDGFSLPIYHFRKKHPTTEDTSASLPAVYHTHGGGYIAMSVGIATNIIATMVSATGVQIFSVDYRLAPEHPFPTPADDAYTGLLWLHEHAAEFNVDTSRIAVYGESAGGGLAAGLAIMARDRQLSPALAKQVLVYPMIDDRNTKGTEYEQLLFWKTADNITGWTAYVGENVGKEGVSPYAAAARVESVEGLPRTYIDCGGLDLFRDENIQFVSRLAAANIEVEFHLYPGVPHAFEAMARGSDLVNRAMANRIKALTSF